MVELTAWFEPGQQEASRLSTPGELDDFLNRMKAESADVKLPVLAEISTKANGGLTVLQVGVNDTKGVVSFVSTTHSAISTSGDSMAGVIEYDYMGHAREIPREAEIDIDRVCQVVHDFLATGDQPSTIAWRILGGRESRQEGTT